MALPPTIHTGHCLCNAVAYTGKGESHMHVCHCNSCTRWSGGPFIGLRFADGIEIKTPDTVNGFASSDWAERGSCKICGTAMFYKLQAEATPQVVSAGTLEAEPAIAIGEHIFIEQKPAYYDFADDAPRITGAEVFERFTGPQDDPS